MDQFLSQAAFVTVMDPSPQMTLGTTEAKMAVVVEPLALNSLHLLLRGFRVRNVFFMEKGVISS